MRPVHRLTGCLLPPGSRHFCRSLRCLTDRRPPPTCVDGFILPRALRLLRSTPANDLPFVQPGPLSLATSRTRQAEERLPWGSLPSSRHQPAASTHGRDPTPHLRSVLGVSHALDGLLRHRPCGFVSPRCHVQGSPCRGLSLPTEPFRLSPASALVPLDETACRFDPAPAIPPSTSGPCSPPGVRCPTRTG
jgi:hypothetical protein